MSDGELFDVPVVKSPRLKWIEKHRLKTKCAEFPVADGDEDEFGNEVFQWSASDDNWKHSHGGATEDDALAAWARARGVRLWNEEGL